MSGNDFTYTSYVDMLKEFRKARYFFAPFVKHKAFTSVLYLRHDIDISLDKAVEMAEIEAENDVQATYFFMMESPLYNVFSKNGSSAVRKIQKLGHHTGIHIISKSCFTDALRLVPVFTLIFCDQGYHSPPVSLHKPDGFSYQETVSGYVNTYNPDFFSKENYTSDSTGTWRFGHPLESDWFKNKRTAQLLIHPVWWGPEKTTLEERRNRAFLAAGNKYHRDLLSEFPLFGGQDE